MEFGSKGQNRQTKNGFRALWLAGAAISLQACGGSGGPGPGTISNPPPQIGSPPPPIENYDTAEYRRSSGAVASKAIAAWEAGANGEGVTIAFIDSGINRSSPEFAGRIVAQSRDVTSAGRDISDLSGHGTSVAGVAAAARNDSGHMGVAWNANIAMFRADTGDCDNGCSFADSGIAAGLDAAVGAGAKVVNISLGGSSGGAQLRNAFARTTAANTIIVVAAGNDGADQVDPLALAALQAGGSDKVIIVGSANSEGAISSFVNRAGTSANNYLLTLGEEVRSFDQNGDAYLYSGSSYSTPIVSAAVALLADAFPTLGAARIVQILLTTADDVGATGTDNINGRGMMNISRAMQPIGQTSLAGTAIAVPTGPNGNLGAAMGNGLSAGSGLSGIVVTDIFDREFRLNLGQTMRTASAGRLAARLQSTGLETAETGGTLGNFTGNLELRALPFQDRPGTDHFRNEDSRVANLGFAHRGVDAMAGNRNPLRETRLALRSGNIGLTAATGRLAAESLPGAISQGFVSDDGLSPDEGTGTDGRQLLMADFRIDTGAGPITLAMAASSRKMPLPATLGLSRTAQQDRMIVAASWAKGPLGLALHLADTQDDGALLGTRLNSAFGLMGGRTQSLGGAISLDRAGYGLRLAGSRGWVSPYLADGGLFRADGDLVTQSWSATATAPLNGGLLSLRLAQPLAVSHGRFLLANGAPVNMAVLAQETTAELEFRRGAFTLVGFHRQDAGNIAGLNDSGAAFTFRRNF